MTIVKLTRVRGGQLRNYPAKLRAFSKNVESKREAARLCKIADDLEALAADYAKRDEILKIARGGAPGTCPACGQPLPTLEVMHDYAE